MFEELTFWREEAKSFSLGFAFIFACIFFMNAGITLAKSVPFGLYCPMSLLAFPIAPFCHEQ